MNVLTIDVQSVRDYLDLNTPGSSSQYSDGTIGSNILMAQSQLEQLTGRYFVDRTFTVDAPWYGTTNNRQQIPLPGFRSFDLIARNGSPLVPFESVWPVPDSMQTGVFTGLAFRAATGPDFWPGQQGTPYGPWITNPQWFDQSADSPFFPSNLGGGIFLTSLPNDLTIAGQAGYSADTIPFAFLMAARAGAAWLTMRPASIMTSVAITPQGGVLTYSDSPPEVRDFIASWKTGQQMVGVG